MIAKILELNQATVQRIIKGLKYDSICITWHLFSPQLVEINAHKAIVPCQGSVKQFKQAHGAEYGSRGAIQGVQDRGRLVNSIRKKKGEVVANDYC